MARVLCDSIELSQSLLPRGDFAVATRRRGVLRPPRVCVGLPVLSPTRRESRRESVTVVDDLLVVDVVDACFIFFFLLLVVVDDLLDVDSTAVRFLLPGKHPRSRR